MNSQCFVIDQTDRMRERFNAAYRCAQMLSAIGVVEVIVQARESKRSQAQNRKLWPMLADISQQVEWAVDGVLQKLPPEDWKTILTAGLTKEQRVACGVSGGFVILGKSTSKMNKREFADLLELLYAFGSEHNVQWSEPFPVEYLNYREMQQ